MTGWTLALIVTGVIGALVILELLARFLVGPDPDLQETWYIDAPLLPRRDYGDPDAPRPWTVRR